MNKFLEYIAEILEVDTIKVSLNTDFRKDIDDWDSMKGFGILCMLEDEYGVILSVESFLECQTIGDIYNKIIRDAGI